jgi:hypothetical protein
MLVLTDCVEINERPAIDYDQFVPVTITWPRYHRLLEPLRIVDIQGSNGYIEFKADTITGELVEVVVPSAVAIVMSRQFGAAYSQGSFCVPVIEQTMSPEDSAENVPRFEIYDDLLRIVLSGKPERHVKGAGSVAFGIGDANIFASLYLHWTATEREFPSLLLLRRTAVAKLQQLHAPPPHVLMADGTTKPIQDIAPGDHITATDPATGETSPRVVTAHHINRDADLTITTKSVTAKAALAGSVASAAVISTTAHHLFWDETTHTWVDGANLTPGHQLHTDDPSTSATIDTRLGDQTMHNLTVDTTHTYYVMAGDTGVLVHN